jgi:hypothetical protein
MIIGFGKYHGFDDVKTKNIEEITFRSIQQMRALRTIKKDKKRKGKEKSHVIYPAYQQI